MIKANYYNSACITTNNRLFIWGLNDYRQISGKLDKNRQSKPYLLKNFLSHDEKIFDLNFGEENTIVLSDKGFVYIWGSNNYGQYGNGTYIFKNDFIKIKTNNHPGTYLLPG